VLNFAHPNSDGTEFNSDANLKVRESGLGEFPLPEVTGSREQLPPGQGRFALPAHLTAVGLVNQTFRAFGWQWDEAMKHSRASAVAMLRDPTIFGSLRDVQLPVAQLSFHLEPEDESDPRQMDACVRIEKAIRKTPRLQQFMLCLLDAIWYGRSAVTCAWKFDKYDPSLVVVDDWFPINGDSLVSRWSSRDWGILVNSQYEGPTDTYALGRVRWLDPDSRESVVIHTHEPFAADYYETLEQGAIRGSGVRSRIFWFWWYVSNIRALMMDLAERTGTGIWVSYFDQSNPEGRSDMERAVAAYRDKRVLSIPRDKEGRTPYGLTIMEPGGSSHAVLMELVNYYDGVIRDFITGHPIGEGSTIRVGGDPTALFEGAISNTTRYHATNLQDSLNRDFVPTYSRYMAPGLPPPKWIFEIETPNAELIAKGAELMQGLGGEIDLDQLREVFTLRKPQPGNQVYSKIQSLSPAAVDSQPVGVPVAGNTPQPAQSQTTSFSAPVQAAPPQPAGVSVQ
jgi:hypothetical protein